MKERPILFSAPMVRALLEGTKTQTRRIVAAKWLPEPDPDDCTIQRVDGGWWAWTTDYPEDGSFTIPCPYGAPGDRLWVRETWAILTGNGHRIVYRADVDPPMTCGGTEPVRDMKWTPSIYMRRQHSRITLEITDVRVERLQAISEEDARAEGYGTAFGPGMFSRSFASCWNEINKDRCPWSSNPWVWAIAFALIEGPPNVVSGPYPYPREGSDAKPG